MPVLAESIQDALQAEVVVGKTVIKEVPVTALHVDRSYQRDTSIDLVQEIAMNMESHAYEPILVSKRENGDLYVVNGQHRMAAAKLLGWKTIQAKVLEGLTPEMEAALRLKLNRKLSERSLERFRAQVAAGIAESLEIVDILRRFGTKVNLNPTMEEGINSVGALEQIYRRDGGHGLVRTLEVIQDAWGTPGGHRTTQPVLKGIAWFLEMHGGEFDRTRLIDKLDKHGPAALDRMARSHRANLGGAFWMNTYRAIVEVYNENLPEGSRLQWRTRGASRAGGNWSEPRG